MSFSPVPIRNVKRYLLKSRFFFGRTLILATAIAKPLIRPRISQNKAFDKLPPSPSFFAKATKEPASQGRQDRLID